MIKCVIYCIHCLFYVYYKGGVNSGFYYYEYNNKKAIIKANNPIASVNANPKIV